LRKTTGTLIDDIYDKGENKLGTNKYTIPISEYMKDEKTGKVNKLTRKWNASKRIWFDYGRKLLWNLFCWNE
jgi:hypothetical protein